MAFNHIFGLSDLGRRLKPRLGFGVACVSVVCVATVLSAAKANGITLLKALTTTPANNVRLKLLAKLISTLKNINKMKTTRLHNHHSKEDLPTHDRGS